MFGLVKKKYYDEVMESNEKILDLCKKQQATIAEQEEIIKKLDEDLYKSGILVKNLQSLLKQYRDENLELKKKPLKNVKDLIEHI